MFSRSIVLHVIIHGYRAVWFKTLIFFRITGAYCIICFRGSYIHKRLLYTVSDLQDVIYIFALGLLMITELAEG
jgi:hypothetical protein